MVRTVCLIILLCCTLVGCTALTSYIPQPASVSTPLWTTVACPDAPLSSIKDEDVDNAYTCVTVTATLGVVNDLNATPPRYALLLVEGDEKVYALWAGSVEGLKAGMTIKIEGAVVNLGAEWGLWVYRWLVVRGESL